ncbi:hypothetical protein CN918_32650 [Priestia megaterium]|nr:hypothetical protein CN918_32650 [Priestia megaterium]
MKVIFPKLNRPNQFVDAIFPHLPENSMVIFTEHQNTKNYLLCVGEVESNDLVQFETIKCVPFIYTKTKKQSTR